MAKMTIIGHRGARGLALENTLPSFMAAIEAGVGTIEFDVHATRDGQFVVCHDNDLRAVSDSTVVIAETAWTDLQQIRLRNGARIPLLHEVLDLARKHGIAVVVEVKIHTHLPELCALLDEYQDVDMTVASFLYGVVEQVHELRPYWRVYVAEDWHPVRAIRFAHKVGAHGLDLRFWLLNPLIYILARRWRLDIMLYTVNARFLVACYRALYPGVAICTDHPERFISRSTQSHHMRSSTPGTDDDTSNNRDSAL